MKTKKEIQKYIKEELESFDYAENFFDLDSLDKLELIMDCESEFLINIEDIEIHNDWDTKAFVDFVYNKIINKNHENPTS
jgi:acyl carrier protein